MKIRRDYLKNAMYEE
jgi:hypothetical protein